MLVSALVFCALAAVLIFVLPAAARTRTQLRFPAASLYTQIGSLVAGVWCVFVAIALAAGALMPDLQPWLPVPASAPALVLATLLTGATVGFWLMATAPVTTNIREVVAVLNTHVTSEETRPGFVLTIVDHPYPTAVSTPGSGNAPGNIVVTSGLRTLTTTGQFQAVLAHEYAHIKRHHGKVLSVVSNLADALPVFTPLKRSVSLLVELHADDIAAKQAGPADLANALAKMGEATNDQSMLLRAERLTTKKWPREHWRTVPEPIRVDQFRTDSTPNSDTC